MSPPVRYNIQVCERGADQKAAVARRIEAAGGVIEEFFEEGFRLGATMTPAQLLNVLRMDEVQYADRWGEPGEDMNNAREVGGANFIELLGSPHFDGTGVRGEVMDQNMNTVHVALQSLSGPPLIHGAPPDPVLYPDKHHGTSTYGIIFGDGTGESRGRGLLPGANHGSDTEGRGIFSTYQNLTIAGGPVSRYTETAELMGYGTAMNLRACFQSNSWGTAPPSSQNTRRCPPRWTTSSSSWTSL